MNVKEAARTAKDYLTDIFADEQIPHVGLEEVEFDEMSKAWKITIGFFGPWERPKDVLETALVGLPVHGKRSFKVVRIQDGDGHFISITIASWPLRIEPMPPRGRFIYANLFVLLVVGATGRELISKHRRLRRFEAEDYERLLGLIRQVDRVFVTPNTLK